MEKKLKVYKATVKASVMKKQKPGIEQAKEGGNIVFGSMVE